MASCGTSSGFGFFAILVTVVILINVVVESTPARASFRQQRSRGTFRSLIAQKDVLETFDLFDYTKHYVKDCMFVTSEVGYFTYVHNSSLDDGTVCGIYFMAEPDRKIEVIFTHLEVPCENDDLVSFVDGWELNGQYFPSPSEHHLLLSNRLSEFCGSEDSKIFVSSQNAALIQYRISHFGKGFTVLVKHLQHPKPCNILADTTTDDIPFMLRNYGERVNCTLIALYPCAMSVTAFKVANIGSRREGSVIRRCNPAIEDQVQVGGTNGIDTSNLDTFKTVCNVRSGRDEIIVGCGVSVVKLISSGIFDNYLNVRIRKTNENDIFETGLFCDFLE